MLEEYWKNKAQELYKEFEQYKKSKQASYEAMQKEWNNAVNELRNLKATDKIEFKQHYKVENERLQAENEELKQKLNWLTIAHKSEQEERTKLELALAKIKVKIINENADDCLLDIKEIIDEVL